MAAEHVDGVRRELDWRVLGGKDLLRSWRRLIGGRACIERDGRTIFRRSLIRSTVSCASAILGGLVNVDAQSQGWRVLTSGR